MIDDISNPENKIWFDEKKNNLPEPLKTHFSKWFEVVEHYKLLDEIYMETKKKHASISHIKNENLRFMLAFENAMTDWDM